MESFEQIQKLIVLLNYLNYPVVCIYHKTSPDEKEYFIISEGVFNYSQNNVDFHEVTGFLIDQAMITDSLHLSIQNIQIKRGVIESRLKRLGNHTRKYSKDYTWILYEEYTPSII